MPPSELMTVDAVAAHLQVHPRTVHRFIREGRLPAKRIGKAYRIRGADLAVFAGLPEPVTGAPPPSLTAFLDVHGVGEEAARLWKRTVATAVASRGSIAPRAEVIHDPAARHVKLMVVGAPDACLALLSQAQSWLKQIEG